MVKKKRNYKAFPKKFCSLEYLLCTELTHQGKGIVKWNNKTFYVDELLPGEEAKIIVYYQTSTEGFGRAIKLKQWSVDRQLPLGHWKFSMGCYHLPHLKDSAQDAFKQSQVEKLFGKALPIIVGKRSYYRNKVSLTNGGFLPPGRKGHNSIIPERYDLMKLDFDQYRNHQGVTLIRRLETEIVGKPGTKIYTYDTMLNRRFRVSLDSFYQVNSQMASLAYQMIKELVPKNSVVFDLFGGAAVIAIHVAEITKQVYSVEINKDCHKDAIANLQLNNINNIELVYGDANQFVSKRASEADVIILDPARSGLSAISTKAINQARVPLIIYLSCNIFSQKNDIDALTNYQIELVQPFDFFPQTYHIENLVVLRLKK